MKQVILLLFLVTPLITVGQINLVPNPSFEDTFHCPNDSTVIKVKSWFNPTDGSSPDFFYPAQVNSGCPAQFPGLWGGGAYSNNWGYQLPHSGIAYAGMAASQGAEIMESPLSDSMRAGKRYAVSFYVSIGDLWGSGFDLIGLSFFNNIRTDYSSGGTLPYTLSNDAGNQPGNIITDTMNWTLVQDTFTAVGGEKYFILGNIDTANTLFYNSSVPTAVYMYFDDFDIHCVDCSTSVPIIPDYPEIALTPTLSDGNFLLKGNFPSEANLEVYNMLGQLVFLKEVEQGNRSLPFNLQVAEGIYTYRVGSGDTVLKAGKLVVMK